MVQKIDISNELKRIQDAVYGEEVRLSIHDGIKKAADTTNIIIEEWTDVNDSMVSLKNSLEASESQRLTNEEARKTQETKRQQDTSKAIREVNAVKDTVEQKLNDGEFIGASGVWLGDSVPSNDYDVWVKPTDIEGVSGLFVRDNASWFEISSIKGEKGNIPKHEVLEKKIRFENSDGSWGAWIDLSTIKASDILTDENKTIQEALNILNEKTTNIASNGEIRLATNLSGFHGQATPNPRVKAVVDKIMKLGFLFGRLTLSPPINQGTTLFQLPAEYRPVYDQYFLVDTTTGNGARIQIKVNGEVAIHTSFTSATVLSLNGITYDMV